MKLFFTCALLAILAKTAWTGDKSDARKICQQEAQATDEELEMFSNNVLNPVYGTDAVKCYIKCNMEKEVDFKDGKLNEELLLQASQIDARDEIENIKKVIAKCKDEKGGNDCDTAYKITTCFLRYPN